MIRFSIITITYNAEHTLQRTLDSVLMQIHANLEHLIVDGASSDATVAMAEAYKKKSDNADNGHDVTVVSEADHGLYDAMNKGLLLAQGDYVVFLNAGDTLPHNDTLQQIEKKARLGEDREEWPAVLYGLTDIVDDGGHVLYPRRLQPPEHLTWRSFLRGMLVCHQAFYARLDLARTLPYNLKYRYSADVDWCIRVMKEALRNRLDLRPLHLTVAHYLEEGQTTLHHRESLKERFHVMTVHYGYLPTILMHLWFVIRAIVRKLSLRKQS